MMATGTGLRETVPILDLFKAEVGYATPKIDVRAAVFDRERILLVRERKDRLWTMPGGWADVGDAPSVAAIREVKEESGYDVTVKKLAAVYDRDKHGHPPMPYHVYKLFFLCHLCDGAALDTLETARRWTANANYIRFRSLLGGMDSGWKRTRLLGIGEQWVLDPAPVRRWANSRRGCLSQRVGKRCGS